MLTSFSSPLIMDELTQTKRDHFLMTSLNNNNNMTNVPNTTNMHHEEFKHPLIDLEGYFKGDELAIQQIAKNIRAACLSHGIFQVINHRVDSRLITDAHNQTNHFFNLPSNKKNRVKKKPGTMWGFNGLYHDSFPTKSSSSWKETLTFGFNDEDSNSVVLDFFKSTGLGKDSERMGIVYQKYCEEMKELSLVIMEILGMSLGLDPLCYKKFFEDSRSIMRCNYYPACGKLHDQAMGTGPHCDPTSLTILHQDEVGGLEVFVNNKWQPVLPRRDAFVINLGDTFTALSNGRYKSCLHRAVLNKDKDRVSLAFFVSPREDKVVSPPKDLVCRDRARKYPDFTWSDFLYFTQYHHKPDGTTLQSFIQWFLLSKSPTTT
ncbi:gibberellin 20 oxidase 1-D-like [Impatiens glandulifera]|uniref:gibberellin 20 oxidase 1-D-like n=1 Tax=Impatiens glandulifera TaxID=253017 RepID=UPI001FB13B79|nr:gibberellin 20 oxidase 1-D-like [Impatiens glandulifera]